MVNILVTDGIDKNALSTLKQKGYEVAEQFYPPDELKEAIKNVDGVIVRSATKITKEIIDAAIETKRLGLIVRAGVGVDNIDVEYAREKGICVCNTPSASSMAVAELAIGHMFALARKMYSANISMRNGHWEKKRLTGVEISGKTLGLIGFGRIAKETARIANALGMKVIYNTRSGKKEGYSQYEYVSMDVLLKQSDFISLHIPYDKESGAVLGDNEFDMMRDGVFLVNCARGGVVKEEALLKALNSGKVTAAALDVFEKEPTCNERLYTHEKVSLSPHIGASTVEAQKKIGLEIIGIVDDYFSEEKNHGCV